MSSSVIQPPTMLNQQIGVFLKTGTRNPNIYSSIGVIKQDLKETEKLLDLLQLGRLKKRVDTNFDQKMEQKRRLKTMLEDQQTDLKSYMTAMGALNIHLDQKTKDRIELLKANGAEGNSSIQNLADLASNDQILNVLDPAGLYGETADGARGGQRKRKGQRRGQRKRKALVAIILEFTRCTEAGLSVMFVLMTKPSLEL